MDFFTQKCVGALIGTFVGDALGMPVEGQSAASIEEQHGRLDDMVEARRGRGTYTDDTQMAIATAESLLNCGGVDREDLADMYLEFHDPGRGYGAGTTRVFNHWQEGVSIDEAAKRVYDGGSFGNGGAMRIAPVGVWNHRRPEELAEAVEQVVGLTHAHRRGIAGGYIQARAVAEAIDTEPPGESFYPTSPDREPAIQFVESIREDLPERCDPDGFWNRKLNRVVELLRAHDDEPPPELVARELGCSSTTGESVPAALLAALVRMDSFDDAVVYAVSIGGDTDTIGAMAGAIAGALYGVGHVPDRWWETLENDDRGRDHVVSLGERLASNCPGGDES